MKGATDSLQKKPDSYDQDYGVLLLNLIKKFEGIYEYFGFSFQLIYFFISQEIFFNNFKILVYRPNLNHIL